MLLSQNGKHSCAAMIGSKAISKLIECFELMKAINNDLIGCLKKRKRRGDGSIDFRFVILKEAKEKL